MVNSCPTCSDARAGVTPLGSAPWASSKVPPDDQIWPSKRSSEVMRQ